MTKDKDSGTRLYGEGSRPKLMGSSVLKWQVLKHELERKLIGEAVKRNIDPSEMIKALQIPASVSRALDALLHDPPAKEPPP